ncbi:MAG: MerR family transcriptional regulator [Clostridia bacterium]|nr:MerR family transcriptional regulator [Clostridia bacterium]
MKSIGEVAKLAGISKRTLHYYDEIGLLTPKTRSDVMYRYYDEPELLRLQQIMFLKEIGFDLKSIMKMMNDHDYDERNALINQRDLLVLKRERLNQIISLVEKTIEGERKMSFKEFDDTAIEKYKEEAKEKYGKSDAYKQSVKKTSKYTKNDWENINLEAKSIYEAFYNLIGSQVNDVKVQQLVKRWQDHITRYYYDCTREILSGLADLYVSDPRFTKNIDKYGEGLASFMTEAIKEYCK